MTSRGQEQQLFAIQVADHIRQLGLRLPALTLLEAGRPLAFVAGQMLWLTQPALALIVPREHLSQSAELLEDPAAVDMLIKLLDVERSDDPGGVSWTE
ncbi:MAG: hypothetical protein JSW55_15790 [Chloroflexota bacterium]|nr:MAG: hypothetical protein JSW55_15790 [Chloroflexota bacterium]